MAQKSRKSMIGWWWSRFDDDKVCHFTVFTQ